MTTEKDIDTAFSKAIKLFPKGTSVTIVRDYLLSLFFYKYISDSYREESDHAEKAYSGNSSRLHRAQKNFRFTLSLNLSFHQLQIDCSNSLSGQHLRETLLKVEKENSEKLRNVLLPFDFSLADGFDSVKIRDELLYALFKILDTLDLRPSELKSGDLIGECFHRWLYWFDTKMAKGQSIPCTPDCISDLIASILDLKQGESVFDPVCGSGRLLIDIMKGLPTDSLSYWGQEADPKTWAFCQMALIMRDLDNHHVWNGDSLSNPLNLDDNRIKTYNCVVGVPPFTLDHWDNVFHSGLEIDMTPSMDPFRRFEWGVPAKSYCSYAFILHMLKCMDKQNGRMAVIAPQGVLYRGGSEQAIRQKIIEANCLDAVIALPPHLYSENTPPLCLMVFKNNRSNTDILFIDASTERFYEKRKKQNLLRSSDVANIFRNRDTEDGISIMASDQDIADHDYVLRVSQYTDTDEEDTEIDISTISKELSAIEDSLVVARSRVVDYLYELGIRDDK